MARRPSALTALLADPRAGLQRLAVLCGLLVAVACTATSPKPAPPVQPAVSIPVAPPPPARPSSGDARFDAFLAEARVTALAQGITEATFDAATAGIAPIAAIAAMNANQPEFSKPVWSYLDSAVSARRIKDAQYRLTQYGDVLARIEASSGVPKEILVAIWGMETDYGAESGGGYLFSGPSAPGSDGARPA